jgi:protein associated with RNAse G/E
MKRLSWFSPALVAVFTVSSLYAANAERLPWTQIFIPLVLALLVSGLFLLLFWLLRWTTKSAPFVALVFTAIYLLWQIIPVNFSVVLMIGTLGIVFYKNINARYIAEGISVIAIFAILISTGQAVITNVQKTNIDELNQYMQVPGQPNIYFIIPDRMPSPAAMRESGIDCDAFVASLRTLGFYVNENQMSYDTYTPDFKGKIYTTRTMRYLASVLNFGKDIPIDVPYKTMSNDVHYNAVFDWLHEKGYTVNNVASWFAETSHLPTADNNYNFTDISLLEKAFQNEFSSTYFNRTIMAGLNFRLLEPSSITARVETARHAWQMQTIEDIALSGATSQFTFAHILLPHQPFVYAVSGSETIPEKYYDNIRYAMTYITQLVTFIRHHDPTAYVMVQADEGMAYASPVSLDKTLSPTQWNGVMTAWYFPDGYNGNLNDITHTQILDFVLNSL